eukprot:gene19298-27338_t
MNHPCGIHRHAIRCSTPSRAPRRRQESGTTLIEALVAMLVLSIGLLGIAGLAAASLRNSQGAWARAAVASGLSDFADRVRANPTATDTAYVFDANDYTAQRDALLDDEVVIARDCLTSACTPTQLATYHLTDWRLAMNRSMPGAAVWVTGRRDTDLSGQRRGDPVGFGHLQWGRRRQVLVHLGQVRVAGANGAQAALERLGQAGEDGCVIGGVGEHLLHVVARLGKGHVLGPAGGVQHRAVAPAARAAGARVVGGRSHGHGARKVVQCQLEVGRADGDVGVIYRRLEGAAAADFAGGIDEP